MGSDKNLFVEGVKPYLTKNGLVARHPGEKEDGNAIHYTACYYIIKYILNIPNHLDRIKTVEVVHPWEVTPGQIRKGGEHKSGDFQAFDDYIVALTMSKLYLTGFAERVHFFGKQRLWTFNNLEPDNKWKNYRWKWMKTWFWRRPGFVPHVKICAGKKLSFFNQVMWCIDIMTTIRWSSGESGVILDWALVVAAMEEDYRLINWCIKRWERKLKKRYPKLMGGAFEEYFPMGSKLHPYAEYMENKT
jgi:hypothetical protein